MALRAAAQLAACLAAATSTTAAAAAITAARAQARGDRKITEVVKLLQDLLDKSQAEGDSEREVYGKYKCFCDTTERTNNEGIEQLSSEISMLGAKIEELQASNGELSKAVAQLDKDMTQNERDREQATALRTKENEAFLAKEADLTGAVSQMDGAVQTLAEVGADQTMSSAQDHKQYMADVQGGSLLKLKSTLNSALIAASAFVTPRELTPVNEFLQAAPFTGAYSARSGEVVGILKSMRDTFKANLAAARDAERRAAKAYDEYTQEMKSAHGTMAQSKGAKEQQLGSNDDDLAAKRDQLGAASTSKAEAEDFLANWMEACKAKAKQYQVRVDMRAQEQAALSQATAVLNSDDAFATFGKVSAASSQAAPGLIQIRQHRQAAASDAEGPRRQRAQAFLQDTEQKKGSSPLETRILSMLQANNPFKVVRQEIEKMLGLLAQEGKADAEQMRWCHAERLDTNAAIGRASDSIRGLKGAISALHIAINDPESGLLAQVAATEGLLRENSDGQASETQERKDENVAYQKDVANLQEAQDLVAQAVRVLTKFYAKVVADAPAFVQVARLDSKDDLPDQYKGQSENGGLGAIDMLKFILTNAQEEERVAHSDELASQHSYEDSMAELKASESTFQESLASLKQTLAEKEKDKMMKEEDLAKTEAEEASLKTYLEKIKPGCDFITANLEKRQLSRSEEAESLKGARHLLNTSPVSKQAEAQAHQESLGECVEICAKSEDHVDCQACLAKVSVPGYCAGHPATEGC